MKQCLAIMIVLLGVSCTQSQKENAANGNGTTIDSAALESSRAQIGAMLDSFNVAATNAQFERYFDFFASDGVFMGTDATEYWTKPQFMEWAKPHFDKKQTWNFVSIERNIYFDSSGRTAWFDELLNTQMKICRGSGVVAKMGNEWKIKQYVLSMTIPNSQINPIVKLKSAEEDSLIRVIEQR
jgi:hypothetical protein